MKLWFLALGILASYILAQGCAGYVQKTFGYSTVIILTWATYAVFPLSTAIVGAILRRGTAFVALLTILSLEGVASLALRESYAIVDPAYSANGEAPAMINLLVIWPSVALSLIAFAVAFFFAENKRRPAKTAG